jgi:uncharacterized protein (TIGR02996 family)
MTRERPAKVRAKAKPEAKAKAKKTDTGEALLAAVAKDLTDDRPRARYADHLGSGDPRAELIRLQLAGGKPLRINALYRRHREAWLGPLAGLVNADHCHFTRGFLYEITLSCTAKEANALAGDPIFATVERVSLDGMGELPTALLQHAVMKHVAHLEGLENDPLGELLAWRAVPYTSLDTMSVTDEADARSLLDARGRLKALRSLGVTAASYVPPSRLAWLWTSWIAKQVEEIRVIFGLEQFPAWLEALRGLAIPRVRITALHGAGPIVLERDGDGLAASTRASRACAPSSRITRAGSR